MIKISKIFQHERLTWFYLLYAPEEDYKLLTAAIE